MSDFPTIKASGAEIHSQLRAAIPDAIATGDPLAQVWSPGFSKSFPALEDLFTDELSVDYLRHGMLRLLTTALGSTDVAIRISTQALLVEWSKRHAAYHLDDALAAGEVSR